MYRIVYFNGLTFVEKWFDDDRDMLKFRIKDRSCQHVVEWRKYERREDATPLENYITRRDAYLGFWYGC